MKIINNIENTIKDFPENGVPEICQKNRIGTYRNGINLVYHMGTQ